MAQLIAEGQTWQELQNAAPSLEASFGTGDIGEMRITSTFALPDWALTGIFDAGAAAGVDFVDAPAMDGNTLVLRYRHHSPAIVAVLGALAMFLFVAAGAFLLAVIAWQVLQFKPAEVLGMMKFALIGGAFLGLLMILKGASIDTPYGSAAVGGG